MNNRNLKEIYVCNDVWLHILPFFGRAQLGLQLALICCRFDALVDSHFNGRELIIQRKLTIGKDKNPKLLIHVGRHKFEEFLLPKCPLPNKIRFANLQIRYIDHSVIQFLRSNAQIFNRETYFCLKIHSHSYRNDAWPIWDLMAREIWPIFATNIRHLKFSDGDHLYNLRRLISPTILSDLNPESVCSGDLFPAETGDDGPTATAAQALCQWLHLPTTDGRPKQLYCNGFRKSFNKWADRFKHAFFRAAASVRYNISFKMGAKTPIEPFEMVNDRTQEKLTLQKEPSESARVSKWLLQRCPIGATTQWRDENGANAMGRVAIRLSADGNCLGPLYPPCDQSKKTTVVRWARWSADETKFYL